MVLNQLRITEYEDEEDGYSYQPRRSSAHTLAGRQRYQRRQRAAVIAAGTGLTTNTASGIPEAVNELAELIVIELQCFEEVSPAVQALQQGKSVVLNLTMLDPEQAQRAVDFLAGATYSIQGNQERLGEGIFLFTPNCVPITTPAH
jgi:cell division inhibitor SepF